MSSVWHERHRTEHPHLATPLALAGTITAVIIAAVSCATTHGSVTAHRQPAIDPEVRVVTRSAPARVLVELTVPEADSALRPRAIERAQDALLGRLRGTNTRVFRRYTSVPMVALEIDADALARLEAMSDLVSRVRMDTVVGPSSHPHADERRG